MFEQTFVEPNASARRPWPVALSFTAQALFTAVVVLVPLLNTARIAWRPAPMILYAPPKPVPPPTVQEIAPSRAVTVQTLRQVFRPAFTAPRHIPATISTLPEATLAPDLLIASASGAGSALPFGPPALGEFRPVAPPTASRPAAAAKQGPMKVSSGVQAAKLLAQPRPLYPPLAKAARISGTVRLQAIIGRDGTIRNLQLIGGQPLLVAAALDAVRQWVYQPTLLNGEPVEVFTEIQVNFTLNP